MDRINGFGTIDIGGGKRGFRDENIGVGVEGTDVTADHLNALQEEIIKVIVEAGLAPDAGDWTQLFQALNALYIGSVDVVALIEAMTAPPHGQCQLRYVSSTQIVLRPLGGQEVTVAGLPVALPAAGVTAANTAVTINGVPGSNLAASTVYLVALSAAGALEFWTFATGHSSDTTAGNIGIEVITGHADKTLVGMVETNASSQFEVSAARVGVISWFNRRDLALVGTTTPGSTTSSIGYVELNSGSRVRFVCWADEAVDAKSIGQGNNGTTAFSVSTGVGVDGVFAGVAGGSYTASGGQNSFTAGFFNQPLSEGAHYITPMGTVGAGGTGTFSVAAFVKIRG